MVVLLTHTDEPINSGILSADYPQVISRALLSSSVCSTLTAPWKYSGMQCKAGVAPSSAQEFCKEEKSMKRLFSSLCLILCALALALSANAQEDLNFGNLPLVSSPSPMPNGYGGLSWGNFFYVNPFSWADAGPGYKLSNKAGDVAFIGGEFCQLSGKSCFGTLTNPLGFVLVSANVAGGYGPAAVIATAYKNGSFVGTANYFVGTKMEALQFPSSWGVVTEVDFQVTGATGDLVFYSISLYTLGG